jgi:hypothetical protein
LYIQRLRLHPLSFRFSFGGNTLVDGTAVVGKKNSGHGGVNGPLSDESSERQQQHRRRRRRKGIGDEESILSKWKASSSFMSGIFTLVDVDTDLRLGECK